MSDKLKVSIVMGIAIGIIISIGLPHERLRAFDFLQGLFNGLWAAFLIHRMSLIFAKWDAKEATKSGDA